VQVLSEFLNVCRVKLGMDVSTRHKLVAELIAAAIWCIPDYFGTVRTGGRHRRGARRSYLLTSS